MIRKILIACTMQMDIINYVIRKYSMDIPVVWLDRKLHNNPIHLHKCIQQKINLHQDVEEILLSYGLCGNAVIGLSSMNTRMIVPAFDDCICQMLYMDHATEYKHFYPEKGCYYLTREWTIDQESILLQCEKIIKDYGREYGLKLIHEIYSGYHSLVLIDNGAYHVDKIRGYVDKAAELTGMCVKIQKGNCKITENLLLGNYDENMIVLEQGEILEYKHWHT